MVLRKRSCWEKNKNLEELMENQKENVMTQRQASSSSSPPKSADPHHTLGALQILMNLQNLQQSKVDSSVALSYLSFGFLWHQICLMNIIRLLELPRKGQIFKCRLGVYDLLTLSVYY